MRFHFSCTRNPHTEREVYTMRTPRLRLLSAILAVAMFFTLLPVSALAEGGVSNANTGLTIGITGSTDSLNYWDVSNSISMKEVSPAVYEVTFENKSYEDIFGIGCTGGFKFVKDNKWDDVWGFGAVSSGELHDAVYYYGALITIDPGSDDERSPHNFIIRLDLTNWDWDTKTGATFTVTVAAATNTFYFDETTGTITKYVESDTVVVIPSKIDGITVETIGHGAFEKSAVTSVTIPDSVTAIHDGAFANCSQLTNISIPNSVTYIGFSAFEHCTSLKSITLPSSLRSISEALFFCCSQLTTIHIPDSVSSIQSYAFYHCGNLETIRIPVSVTFIGVYAFDGCPSSMTVTYSGSKKQWDKITGTDELPNNPLVCNKLEATFDPGNGEPTVTKFIDNDKNSKFTELVPEPIKENHTFAGWYNGDEKFDFTTVPTGDVTLTAKWTANDYYVSFVTEHGDPPTSQNVTYNGTATDPGTLTEEGYTFIGWYADKDLTQRITEIKLSGSKTVYADWKKREPDAVKNPFADVNAGDWFYRDVLFSYEKGLMSGMDAAAFAPYANTTRAQIAVIFYRMEGSPAVEGENSFTDVVRDSGTAWFYDAVTWAQKNGIMGGYGNSSFAPNDPITREQLAAIFYRYAQYKGYDTTQGGMAIREFDDYESISDYAMGAMAWAVNTGLVKGDSNLLYPKGTATRAEIAALFHRFAENGMK